MDIEKLTEARSKFIRDNKFLIGNNAPLVADAFDACAESIMKMPISDRLTEEEKEKIKGLYRRASYPSNRVTFTGRTVLRLFPSIFGADLFK